MSDSHASEQEFPDPGPYRSLGPDEDGVSNEVAEPGEGDVRNQLRQWLRQLVEMVQEFDSQVQNLNRDLISTEAELRPDNEVGEGIAEVAMSQLRDLRLRVARFSRECSQLISFAIELDLHLQ